jgi:hypothetical protein
LAVNFRRIVVNSRRIGFNPGSRDLFSLNGKNKSFKVGRRMIASRKAPKVKHRGFINQCFHFYPPGLAFIRQESGKDLWKVIPWRFKVIPRGFKVIPRSFKVIPWRLKAIPWRFKVIPWRFKAIPQRLKVIAWSFKLKP